MFCIKNLFKIFAFVSPKVSTKQIYRLKWLLNLKWILDITVDLLFIIQIFVILHAFTHSPSIWGLVSLVVEQFSEVWRNVRNDLFSQISKHREEIEMAGNFPNRAA